MSNFPQKAFDLVSEAFMSKSGATMAYCDPKYKAEAHRAAMRLLRYFATDILKVPKGSMAVHSNKGGIAVSGEVSLYTDHLHGTGKGIMVQISDSCVSSVMFRTVDSRQDFTGGKNCFTDIRTAFRSKLNMEQFAAKINQMCAGIAFQVL